MKPRFVRGKCEPTAVTPEWLARAHKKRNKNYPVAKWLHFLDVMAAHGVACRVYIAKSSVSKYVYADANGVTVKLRFSEHPPNRAQIESKDSDIYVGVSSQYTCTTDMAIAATLKRLGVQNASN